jgi:hypothetical protein
MKGEKQRAITGDGFFYVKGDELAPVMIFDGRQGMTGCFVVDGQRKTSGKTFFLFLTIETEFFFQRRERFAAGIAVRLLDKRKSAITGRTDVLSCRRNLFADRTAFWI